MENSIITTTITILAILDVLLAATRSSLINAAVSDLMVINEMRPGSADRTLTLLKKVRLRAALRLSMVMIHVLLGAFTFWYFQTLLGTAQNVWIFLGIMVLVALLILAVEFIIEGVILKHRENWAIRMTPAGTLVYYLLFPFTTLLLPLLGPSVHDEEFSGGVTEDELKTWVEKGEPTGELEQGEREMIYSIFQFGDTLCREIMIPRVNVLALDADVEIDEAIREVLSSGHSRMPVYENTIDNVIGLLYAKDMLRVSLEHDKIRSVRELLRPAYFVPEAKKVDELLREMQKHGIHAAIVVDEYGGVAGLVTLEDIVEEIVGDIRDEYDGGEELAFQVTNANDILFQGRIDIDDFNELTGLHLPREGSDTLGGYVYSRIGRVPVGGEQVQVEDWLLTVEKLIGRQIRKVRAVRTPDIEGQEEIEKP
ncbi:MAG: HlyC/CorC family transporter [Anaerolineaceae bacterium]|nr:HlyC/CorC family transporter [Anaerolineaceae bacterium]